MPRSQPQPSKRRDAVRSRAALIAAAREVFDEQGVGAPLDQIAKRADLANATLYRHFPDREALIEAAFVDEVEAMRAGLERVHENRDPWGAFEEMLDLLFSMQAENRGFGELMTMSFPNIRPIFPLKSREALIPREIVERAQAVGALRPEFRDRDLPALLWAQARILEATRDVVPDGWRRFMGFMVDGLRAEASRGEQAHAFTDRTLERCMQGLALRAGI